MAASVSVCISEGREAIKLGWPTISGISHSCVSDMNSGVVVYGKTQYVRFGEMAEAIRGWGCGRNVFATSAMQISFSVSLQTCNIAASK